MPSRILREGINSSPAINALSPLAELFYRRLMTVADDYGRYYASPVTLRGACWPSCPEKVSDKQIASWLEECCSGDSPLIIVYEVSGAKYLEIQNFGQQTRGKSKFPEIKRLAIVKQMLSNCEANAKPIRISDSYSESNKNTPSTAPKPGAECASLFDEFWELYPRKVGVDAAKSKWKTRALTPEIARQIIDGLKLQIPEMLSREDKYRPHASTWLNEGRWKDQINVRAPTQGVFSDYPPLPKYEPPPAEDLFA